MKSFLLLLSLSIFLCSAEIDTKLYDGNNTISYHEEIAKRIKTEQRPDQNQTQEDKERIATERMILGKLSKMLSFTLQVDPMPDSLLPDDKNISTENYLSYLNALTDTYAKIDTLKKEQSAMQSKRHYLKQSINDITVEDKKNLLLYQLQYAFYKLKGDNQAQTIKAYETLLNKGEERFKQKLKQVTFNIPALEKKLAQINTKFSPIEQEAVALKLAKERELIVRETISDTLSKKFLSNEMDMMSLVTTKIDQTLMLSLAYLQKDKTQKALDLFNADTEDLQTLTTDLIHHYTYKRTILKTVFKEVAGNVALALSNVEESAESIYDFTYGKLTEALFVFNERGISTLDILKVMLIIIFGFIIAAFYKRKIINLATQREKISLSSAKAISNAGYYILVFITLLFALKSIGLDLSNLGLVAGALSIGIGFGLQTLVSNFAAGIILMFERTIRLGDYIEISDTIRGTVSDMRMRSTTVTTNDNIDVVIPNSSFIQNNVINWTLENDIRRIHIPFSVAYGTSNDKVEKVILEELRNSDINYVKKNAKYPTVLWMTAMGSSSVDYELVVWIRGLSTLRPSGTKSDFLKFIYATLYKHHIEIPFPQLDLHVKNNEPKKEQNEEKKVELEPGTD
jgi:small-conductance mechanosensitive channel